MTRFTLTYEHLTSTKRQIHLSESNNSPASLIISASLNIFSLSLFKPAATEQKKEIFPLNTGIF